MNSTAKIPSKILADTRRTMKKWGLFLECHGDPMYVAMNSMCLFQNNTYVEKNYVISSNC